MDTPARTTHTTHTPRFARQQALSLTPIAEPKHNKRTRQLVLYPDAAQHFVRSTPHQCLCYDLENGLVLVTYAEPVA